MKFSFNQQVIFDSDTGTLYLVDTPDDAVQISNPTKRLLMLLVCHQGEVIHREVIFKKVWDDFGMVSSNNNLNHCISKLRRILRNLGLEDEVITTVPKLGFMFHQQITVELLPEENDVVLDSRFADLSVDSVQHDSPDILQKKASRSPYLATHVLSLITFICSVLALIAALYFGYQYRPEERKEIYIGEAGSCNVLVSIPLQNSDDPESFKKGILKYAQALNPQCRSDQYVLVIKSTSFKAYSHDLSRLYFMLCGNLRDNKAEVCWSVSESKADR
jgi:DNA-binding winged-HTH domains